MALERRDLSRSAPGSCRPAGSDDGWSNATRITYEYLVPPTEKKVVRDQIRRHPTIDKGCRGATKIEASSPTASLPLACGLAAMLLSTVDLPVCNLKGPIEFLPGDQTWSLSTCDLNICVFLTSPTTVKCLFPPVRVTPQSKPALYPLCCHRASGKKANYPGRITREEKWTPRRRCRRNWARLNSVGAC